MPPHGPINDVIYYIEGPVGILIKILIFICAALFYFLQQWILAKYELLSVKFKWVACIPFLIILMALNVIVITISVESVYALVYSAIDNHYETLRMFIPSTLFIFLLPVPLYLIACLIPRGQIYIIGAICFSMLVLFLHANIYQVSRDAINIQGFVQHMLAIVLLLFSFRYYCLYLIKQSYKRLTLFSVYLEGFK